MVTERAGIVERAALVLWNYKTQESDIIGDYTVILDTGMSEDIALDYVPQDDEARHYYHQWRRKGGTVLSAIEYALERHMYDTVLRELYQALLAQFCGEMQAEWDSLAEGAKGHNGTA